MFLVSGTKKTFNASLHKLQMRTNRIDPFNSAKLIIKNFVVCF